MWQAVGWEGEREIRPVLFYTNTGACWEITGGCSLRGRSERRTNCFPPSVSAPRSACACEQPGWARGECWPPADLGSRGRLLRPPSKSIKSWPTANKPWQISSFEIHFGTAVVPSKPGGVKGGGGAGSSQYNVCRVSAHPGWQQHERLSQETSVLLSHSTAGQSIRGSALRALLIVIYLGGVIMLSREMTEE